MKNLWASLKNAVVREPVQIAGLFAALIQILSSLLLPLTSEQQGAVNAVVVTALGFIAAASVSEEKALPAVAGLIQAVLACALAFNVHLNPQVESSVMAFVAALTAFVVRPQVTAHGGPAGGKHEAHPMKG